MPVHTGDEQRGPAIRLSTQPHTSTVRTTITSRLMLTQLPLIIGLLNIPVITAHSTYTTTHASPRAHTASSASHIPCPPPHTIHPRRPAPHNNTCTHKPQTVKWVHNTSPKDMTKKPTVASFTAAPSSTRALTGFACPFSLAMNSGVAPVVCPHNHTHPPFVQCTHQGFCIPYSSSPSSSSLSSPRSPHAHHTPTYQCARTA
jgi:hypothetical protein